MQGHARAVGAAGAKNRDHIYEAFEAIYPVLQQFRKGESAPAAAPPPTQQQPQPRLPAASNVSSPLRPIDWPHRGAFT